jgi:hypothetical protein
MFNDYAKQFYAAQDWTNRHTDPQLNYPLKIDDRLEIDMDQVVSALAEDFSDFVKSTDILPGNCFPAIREVSYVLFDLKIRHVVTIGDVQIQDDLYVGMSKQKLKKELREGYKIKFNDSGEPVGVPADAHAWITLENGQIIDATILASMNRREAREALNLRDCFYYFGRAKDIYHIPLMTGFGYYSRVLTDPRDSFYEIYKNWYSTHFGFMERQRLMR